MFIGGPCLVSADIVLLICNTRSRSLSQSIGFFQRRVALSDRREGTIEEGHVALPLPGGEGEGEGEG